jgi:hypothetical protein
LPSSVNSTDSSASPPSMSSTRRTSVTLAIPIPFWSCGFPPQFSTRFRNCRARHRHRGAGHSRSSAKGRCRRPDQDRLRDTAETGPCALSTPTHAEGRRLASPGHVASDCLRGRLLPPGAATATANADPRIRRVFVNGLVTRCPPNAERRSRKQRSTARCRTEGSSARDSRVARAVPGRGSRRAGMTRLSGRADLRGSAPCPWRPAPRTAALPQSAPFLPGDDLGPEIDGPRPRSGRGHHPVPPTPGEPVPHDDASDHDVIPDAAMSWRIPVGAVAARLRTGVTRPGAEHFAVAGEVDAAEAAALTDALLEVLRATACPVVVLDLAEVTFLGSRGLSMIVAAAPRPPGTTSSCVGSPVRTTGRSSALSRSRACPSRSPGSPAPIAPDRPRRSTCGPGGDRSRRYRSTSVRTAWTGPLRVARWHADRGLCGRGDRRGERHRPGDGARAGSAQGPAGSGRTPPRTRRRASRLLPGTRRDEHREPPPGPSRSTWDPRRTARPTPGTPRAAPRAIGVLTAVVRRPAG